MGDFGSSGSIHGPPGATMQIIRASMALGVISFVLGNPPTWTLPGLIVLAIALVAFPVPEDEPGR
jgi:hypothetical protein